VPGPITSCRLPARHVFPRHWVFMISRNAPAWLAALHRGRRHWQKWHRFSRVEKAWKRMRARRNTGFWN